MIYGRCSSSLQWLYITLLSSDAQNYISFISFTLCIASKTLSTLDKLFQTHSSIQAIFDSLRTCYIWLFSMPYHE